MTASTASTVQYLNLAYFGRPADPASLIAYPATGMTDEQIVEAFVSSNEYTTNTLTPATVGTTVNQTSLINTFYQRLFGRLAVSEEVAGWTTALATGTVNEDYLGITIMRAGLNLPAGTEMRQVLEAKFASADLFTTALASDSASAAAYSTAAAISSAANFLSGITTTTAATTSEATDAVTAMVGTGTAGLTFTLTTGVDSISGTTDNDTINATESTLTQGDSIKGGAGNDTLSITAATASIGSVPTDLTLESVEAITISTTGDLGVTATTGASQIDKITFPTVTADVQQVNEYVLTALPTNTATDSFTYGGSSGTFANTDLGDIGTVNGNAASLVASINAIQGSTVAFVGDSVAADGSGSAQSAGTDIIIDALTTGFVPTVGMSVTGTAISAGTTVAAWDGSSSTVTLSATTTGTIADNAVIKIGGGDGGLAVFAPTAGTPVPALAVTPGVPTQVVTTTVTANVSGNEGDVVSFTYAGQSGQYTIGATNDATATAFAGALNAVASDATAAVVAGSGDTDYVTLKADTPGSALGSLVFSSAGSNTPTVTTTTANGTATVAAAAYDVSGLTTDTVTVTLADSVNLKAAVGDDVNISGVSGAIALDGGKNVVVNDKILDANIDLNNVAGTATVTDTKLGSGAITVDGATDVTVVASDATGTVTVGETAKVTGAVSVSYAGDDYDAAASALTLGAIRVDGGTTVDITAKTGSDAKAITDTSSVTAHTFGAIRVDAEEKTTAITITQDAAVSAVSAEDAVTAKSVTQTATFSTSASGDAITLTFDTNDTIVFTTAKALTAAETAAAFANIAKNGAYGSAVSTDGIYTNGSGTIEDGWSSGGVTTNADGTASVTFTSATAGKTISIANAGTGTATATTANSGAAVNQAVTGRMGVTNSAIDINGASTSTADAVKTVTLTNYAGAAIDSDVLETLNLTGATGSTVVTTASTGSVTANLGGFASTSVFSLDGTAATVTGLTVNATGAVATDIIAAAATSLTVNSDYAFTAETSSSFAAAKTVTATGSGAIDLSGDSADAATSVNASATTGGFKAAYASNVGTATGGSGNDVFTSSHETISKAVSLGDGDDTYVLVAQSVGSTTVTATFDGGDGIDTISMDDDKAAALDGSSVFADDLTNFEVLNINSTMAAATINVGTLGFGSNVILNGSTTAAAAIVAGLAANANVTFATANAQGSQSLTLATATGASDVINLKIEQDGDLNAGAVTVTAVETINLSAVDKFVDVTGAKDAFNQNIADGVDDSNSAQGIALLANGTATINVTGSADLTLDINDANGATQGTTLVDALAFTGAFTLVADGKTTGMTVKGGSGVNTLTADGSNDVFIGQGSNDKFTVTELTTVTGGGGNDTIVFATQTDQTDYSTVTDASSGDIIDFGIGSGDLLWNSAAVTLSSQSTFAQYLDAAAGIESVADDINVRWFQFGGNTYLVRDIDDDNSGSSTDSAGFDPTAADGDAVLELQGLFDLSTASVNDTAGQITLA
jgi:S-layer protein